MAQQNKVAVNLAQDFTDEQKAQARANIGAAAASDIPSDIPSIIRRDTYSGGTEYDVSTLLLDRQSSDTAVIKSGTTKFGSTVPAPSLNSDEGKVPVAYYRDGRAYYLLEKKNYVPDSNSTNNGKVLTVDNGVPVWASKLATITTYDASFGAQWATMIQLDRTYSSGGYNKDVTLSTPIPLSAGKKYLISPIGLIGNVEQTKTISQATNVAYLLRIWLWDSSKTLAYDDTAVVIGEAELANHNVTSIGQYPPVNGVYRGSFAPTDAIITPTQDLSLDTLRISNIGNIDLGFNSSNPAILVMDTRISGINVMEIQ